MKLKFKEISLIIKCVNLYKDILLDTCTFETEEKDKKEKVVRVERSYGSYSRSFDISGVDADQIKAKYENGVLKLTLPKKQVTLPEGRRLEIE